MTLINFHLIAHNTSTLLSTIILWGHQTLSLFPIKVKHVIHVAVRSTQRIEFRVNGTSCKGESKKHNKNVKKYVTQNKNSLARATEKQHIINNLFWHFQLCSTRNVTHFLPNVDFKSFSSHEAENFNSSREIGN